MYQGRPRVLSQSMSDQTQIHLLPCVAIIATVRDMETGLMTTTKTYPVGAVHSDANFTPCEHPEECGEMHVWIGGAALATFGE